MQTRPSSRRSSSRSATTRSTIRPTVSQPILSNPQIGVRAICWASHDVLEVARVCRTRPGPRHRLHANTAGPAAQQPQLALDHAAAGAEIEVAPALDAAVMDLELTTGLAAH